MKCVYLRANAGVRVSIASFFFFHELIISSLCRCQLFLSVAIAARCVSACMRQATSSSMEWYRMCQCILYIVQCTTAHCTRFLFKIMFIYFSLSRSFILTGFAVVLRSIQHMNINVDMNIEHGLGKTVTIKNANDCDCNSDYSGQLFSLRLIYILS